MRFRTKVLTVSLIVLSVCLSMIGYLMVRKNYDMALENALENAIMENNLMQASVEYELLKTLNSKTSVDIKEALGEIGGRMAGSVLTDGSAFMIYYDNTYVYESQEGVEKPPKELFTDMSIGRKQYIYIDEGNEHYIYVSSFNPVEKKDLHIISKRNIGNVAELLRTLVDYYRIIIAIALVFAGGLLWFMSRILTKPLERLNTVSEEVAKGNYSIRADVKTNDEIGLLADKFNHMTEAIDMHVNELNDMVKRRDQFVADFTHEIKTPMTAIIGYADTMRSVNLDKYDQMMALSYIFSEGKRLEAMSKKLFDLIYLRDHDIERKSVFVPDMVEELQTITGPLLERNNITLEVSADPARISADRELLVTAYVNLIDNARKASPEGGRIELLGRSLERGYELSVIDHGIGMSEEQSKRICDEFYMVDKSRSRKEGGAGLGMSLVAIILERHNAKLTVESEPGKGTCMRVLFVSEEVHND